MTTWHRLCSVAEIPEDRPLALEIAGIPLVVFRQGDGCHVLHDVCTHAFARLSAGFVEDGAVECALHGARFDIGSGRCVSTPPYDDVRCYETRLEGGDLMVRLDGEPHRR